MSEVDVDMDMKAAVDQSIKSSKKIKATGKNEILIGDAQINSKMMSNLDCCILQTVQ